MTDWRARAACLDHDPEMWFEPVARDEAVNICKGCDVRDDCETFSDGEHWGIWAGIDRGKEWADAAEAREAERQAKRARKTEQQRARARRADAIRRQRVTDGEARWQAGDRDEEAVWAHETRERILKTKREAEHRARKTRREVAA